MIVTLQTQTLQTLAQIRDFVSANEAVAFKLTDRTTAYAWMSATLKQFHYAHASRADKGVLRQYLLTITGLSRAQVARCIAQFAQTGGIKDRRHAPALPFVRRYTDTVIECSVDGCKIIKGKLDASAISALPDPLQASAIDFRNFDHIELKNAYAKSVSQFINAIKAGSIERATLSRKVISPIAFDLASTFIANYSQHPLARSFYFSNEHIAFAGQSPELLAEGNCRLFATHKLSGTHEKTEGASVAASIHRFKNDPRIVAEHFSAIATIENTLNTIGEVAATKLQVMDLPTLLHGWSQFITQPKQPASITDCLRAILPFGVNPVIPAFELLKQHENFSRGPYYGLAGIIQPDGQFSFTQVLRSAFIDKDSSYLMAGAAITAHSTAELETTETCTKLYSIKVFENHND